MSDPTFYSATGMVCQLQTIGVPFFQLIYQYIPSVQFTPPIPVGHVQLNVLLPLSLQLPPFKQGLGSHTEGAEKDKKKKFLITKFKLLNILPLLIILRIINLMIQTKSYVCQIGGTLGFKRN